MVAGHCESPAGPCSCASMACVCRDAQVYRSTGCSALCSLTSARSPRVKLGDLQRVACLVLEDRRTSVLYKPSTVQNISGTLRSAWL